LVVHPDAVLAAAGAAQRLEAITWGPGQLLEPGCRGEHHQLAQSGPLSRAELGDLLSLVEPFGEPVLEGSDHTLTM
jgi:hypothetical protein